MFLCFFSFASLKEAKCNCFNLLCKKCMTSFYCDCSCLMLHHQSLLFLPALEVFLSFWNDFSVTVQVLQYIRAPRRFLHSTSCAPPVQSGIPLQPGPNWAPTPGRTGTYLPLWGRWDCLTCKHTHTPCVSELECLFKHLWLYLWHQTWLFITITIIRTMSGKMKEVNLWCLQGNSPHIT